MSDVTATIVFPVMVTLKNVDIDRLKSDDDYAESIKDELIEIATIDFEISSIKPIIHESSEELLVE